MNELKEKVLYKQSVSKVKILAWAVGIFLVAYFAVTVFAGDTSPIAQTPTAQKLYNSIKHQECLAETNLVNAKINDYSNNLIELTTNDIIRLHEKRNNDCPLL